MARLLVVDDEVYIRDSLSAALRLDGHTVALACNTAQALIHIEERVPDLILSDICMEGGGGVELLQNIRKNPRTGAVPFIIMTGHPDERVMAQGIESAADGYIAKPFSLDTLRKAVSSRLGREALARKDASEIRTQLYRVFQAAPDLIGLADPETLEFFFLNSAGRKMLETNEEFERRLMSFFSPATANEIERTLLPALHRSGQCSRETVLIPPSGKRIQVQLLLQSHYRHDGKMEYVSVIARDLTEQYESTRALRASELRFRCLVDSLPDAVVIYRADGQITFCNSRTVELLLYSPDELLKLTIGQVFAGGPPQPAAKRQVPGHLHIAGEHSVVCKSGEKIPVSVFLEPLDLEGEPLQLCIIHDLTERKRIERERQEFELQLRQAQKLESIGQLAAGIAHEINTPTQYIGDNTRFLKDSFQHVLSIANDFQKVASSVTPSDMVHPQLKAIRERAAHLDLDYVMQEIPCAIDQSLEGIERVAKIVRAMKDFSHPNSLEKSFIDIKRAIESTLTVARNEWKYVADVVTEFDTSLPLIPCLPGEFNQVILNLVVNAAHAIGDVVRGTDQKGVIRVTAELVNDCAEIRISDTGSGIPEAIRPRIFEPFFTTKGVGKGTGQGLAIARSVVVDKHAGTIHFETELGKGTTFVVRLPRTDSVQN